jgi:hypothetical protein
MAVVGTRSGDGSFVTKRTRTWRDGSATMAAAEKVFACSNGAGFGRTFRVLPDNDARSMYIPTVLSVRRELVRPSTAVLASDAFFLWMRVRLFNSLQKEVRIRPDERTFQ